MKTSKSSLELAPPLVRCNPSRALRELAVRVALGAPAVTLALTAVASSALVACDDENDPKTWVKRLDDPAQRAGAIKRLTQFFEDDMTKANKNRDDPSVKALLDDIVDPMTKQYVAATLDEKTRKDLMKFLADTRDPRTGPALAKAFNEYEPGKNEEDVKYAAKAVQGLAEAKKLTDQTVKDALWNCFDKFQVSKTKMFELVKALHDAVIAVSDPSYGPKAIAKLNAPVDLKNVDSQRDHLQFWQITAVQLEGNLRYAPAAKPLVTILLTPTKKDLVVTTQNALLKIAKDAEPVLIGALNGSDKDFATLEAIDTNKDYVATIGDTLANISRPAGRDAVLAALATADNDSNRTLLAAWLTKFPSDPRLVPTFLAAYKKIPPNTSVDRMQGANAHGLLAQQSANFYDPALTDWLVKEIYAAKGDEADAMQLLALKSAIKLMQPAQKAAVQAAVNKEGTDVEKDEFKRAAAVLDKCNTDPSCYVGALDQQVPSTPPSATMTPAKAAWMAAIYGNAATKTALAAKVDKVKEHNARFDVVSAIDHLAPNGDSTVSSQLDTIVLADTASGNKELLMADDVVAKVAARLRARAQ
jgi:hypothetical protein